MGIKASTGSLKRGKYKQAYSAENRKLFWLFLWMLIALNLPNFIWLQPNSSLVLNATEYLEKILLCMLLASCFLCLFSRPWVAWLCLWALFLCWQPLAFGVRAISGTPITATLIGTAVATSPAELHNLLTSIPWAWFVFFAVWNLCCLLILYWLRRQSNWRWSGQFRGKTFFFCFMLLALPSIVLPSERSASTETTITPANTQLEHDSFAAGHPLHQLDEADQTIGLSHRLPNSFPYELPWAIAQYHQARQAIYAIRANLQEPDNAYSLNGYSPAADIVVLVIGESSTRNAWHWFNPLAPATTPRLEARAAQNEYLFGFSRTLAQSTATRLAVPSILTAQPLVWPDGTPNTQATYSIVNVAKKAGYATAWLSNQAATGKYDGTIASYAEEAETIAFLNPSSFYAQGNYDAVLLPALQRHLDTHKQAFVVLHTMGSHFNYQHRYPAGFGLYPNTRNDREAYFNSIFYTDYVLDKVIETLAKDGRKAVLVYASDHGESVPDGACKARSANRNTRDAYEVPALVWLSDSYAKTHPEVITQLSKNTHKPYSVAAVAQTLLDLMRADNHAAVPDPHVQSFVRSSLLKNEYGQDTEPLWTQRFEEAATKNECFIILR